MKNKIAKFEKISFYEASISNNNNNTYDELKEMYENLKLPKRATKGSAGYDCYLPKDIIIPPKSS